MTTVSNRVTPRLHLLTIGAGRMFKVIAGNRICVIDLPNDRFRVTPGSSLEQVLSQRTKAQILPRGPLGDPEPLSEWQTSPSLKWQVGLNLSQGELVSGLHERGRFKLLRWPSADVIKMSSDVMTLCAIFGRQSGATVAEAVTATGLSSPAVIAFINGAYLARAISVRAFDIQPPSAMQVDASSARSLFQKIRNRLRRPQRSGAACV